MMFNGLFTQIVTVVVAVAIVLTYVQPAFQRISVIQDSIAVYSDERKKVSEVNVLLRTLTQIRESVTAADERAILTYLPNSVDPIAVQRDLESMLTAAGMGPQKIVYDDKFKLESSSQDTEETNPSAVPHPHPYGFSVSAIGDYVTVKQFLSNLPSNQYPLEVHELKMTREANGLFSFTAVIVTYGHEAVETRIPFAS